MKKKKAVKKKKAKAVRKPKARKAVKSKAKRSPVKRAPKKAKAETPPTKGVTAPANGVLLGLVEDYFAKIGVIALTLKSPVAVGQRIQVLGHTTNFEQRVESMQIDHLVVTEAGPGDGIGVKVGARARAGDHVYLLK